MNILPESTQETLVSLRENDLEEFYRVVKSLREAGWSLREIAEPLGSSRTIIAIWSEKADDQEPEVEIPIVEKKEAKPRRKKQRHNLSEKEKLRLRSLTEEASKVRRFTDHYSPSRQAAFELEELLHHYNTELNVSMQTLADACGVSRGAIAQRLRKIK